MSVLVDVLNVAKEKRYMVLDPVVQEPPEARNAMHLMGKKKVWVWTAYYQYFYC